jgi:hypothetical protein
VTTHRTSSFLFFSFFRCLTCDLIWDGREMDHPKNRVPCHLTLAIAGYRNSLYSLPFSYFFFRSSRIIYACDEIALDSCKVHAYSTILYMYIHVCIYIHSIFHFEVFHFWWLSCGAFILFPYEYYSYGFISVYVWFSFIV